MTVRSVSVDALFGEAPTNPRLLALRSRLAALDIDALSPRQALDLLAELHSEAQRAAP